MFKELHAMAKDATLLITAKAEGDQLRVSVTPTYPSGKVPAGAAQPRPLSVLGSPDELNADFAAALTIWRAPKLSILEQAKAAADPESGDATKPAAVKPGDKPKGKPGRKPKSETTGAAGAEQKGDSDSDDGDDDGAGAGSENSNTDAGAAGPAAAGAPADAPKFELTPPPPDAGAAPVAPAAAEPPPVVAPVVDTQTIDLF